MKPTFGALLQKKKRTRRRISDPFLSDIAGTIWSWFQSTSICEQSWGERERERYSMKLAFIWRMETVIYWLAFGTFATLGNDFSMASQRRIQNSQPWETGDVMATSWNLSFSLFCSFMHALLSLAGVCNVGTVAECLSLCAPPQIWGLSWHNLDSCASPVWPACVWWTSRKNCLTKTLLVKRARLCVCVRALHWPLLESGVFWRRRIAVGNTESLRHLQGLWACVFEHQSAHIRSRPQGDTTYVLTNILQSFTQLCHTYQCT